MEIAVVILNWNGAEILPRFLPSVCEHSDEATVYLVDNHSTDESVAWVRREFPQVNIVTLDKNYGFAGGYNLGLKEVQEPILALINSDLEVSPGWLTPIRAFLLKHPEVGALQPKILDYRERDRYEYAGAAGGFQDIFAYPYCRGRIFQELEKDRGQYDTPTPVFWATGACMIVRKEVFDEVGGFDTDYFAHQEEIDLCWRIRNKGHKVYFLPDSKVYHLGGGTLEHSNPRKTYLNFRNSLFNLLKNAPVTHLPLLIPSRLVLDGIAGLYFASQNKWKHVWAIVRAHFSFYRYTPKLWKKRVKIVEKKYYHSKSIVYLHFVKGIKTFSSLAKD